jgi:hypothetical protein
MAPGSRKPPTHCVGTSPTAVAHLAGVGRSAVLVHPARSPMPKIYQRTSGSNKQLVAGFDGSRRGLL